MKKSFGVTHPYEKFYHKIRSAYVKHEHDKERRELRDYSDYWTTTPDIEIRWKKI